MTRDEYEVSLSVAVDKITFVHFEYSKFEWNTYNLFNIIPPDFMHTK